MIECRDSELEPRERFVENLLETIYIVVVKHMHMSEIRDLVEVGSLPSSVIRDPKEA